MEIHSHNQSHKSYLDNKKQKAMFPIASRSDLFFDFVRPFCVPEKSSAMIWICLGLSKAKSFVKIFSENSYLSLHSPLELGTAQYPKKIKKVVNAFDSTKIPSPD